jgi:hypothetical protein
MFVYYENSFSGTREHTINIQSIDVAADLAFLQKRKNEVAAIYEAELHKS